MFENVQDDRLKEMLDLHTSIITGQTAPAIKKSPPPIPHSEFGFLNLMVFINAFAECKRRGIVNAAEIAIGDQIMKIINPV